MSINDIQNELNNIKSGTADNNISEEYGNIKSILKKNIKNLESFVDGKVINMYARPWNKLEQKLKRIKMKTLLTILLSILTLLNLI